jgi:hypothetical protein
MPNKPVTPLRQRMIDDMTARRFGEHTQRDYVRAVKNFADYLGCSPAKASAEDLRRYQLHLSKQRTARRPSTRPAARCGFSSRSRWTGRISSGIWRRCSGRARCRPS